MPKRRFWLAFALAVACSFCLAPRAEEPAPSPAAPSPDSAPAEASAQVFAQSPAEKPEWKALFDRRGVEGCLAIREIGGGGDFRHNPERCAEGFLPASTFKIPNSLIALETGVAPDENFALPWDGKEREVAAWNRDHTLASAFRYSALWYYQEIARRVGEERMRAFVERLGYGNRDISGGIDQFWLSGGLRISAEEQVDFVERLATSDLPVSERSMALVREMMVVDRGEGWALRGKTGLAMQDNGLWIGWLVGYVENGGRSWAYALNIEGESGGAEFRQARHDIVREALASLGALDG